MEDWKLGTFVREVEIQASIFKLSAADLNAAIGGLRPTSDDADTQFLRAFSALQSSLSAAAMISKLLWVNPVAVDHMGQPLDDSALRIVELSKQRARTLRRALDIRAVPILQSRKVRNAIEHFDDRLDRFFDTPHRFWVVDQNIGPKVVIELPAGEDAKFARHFDPATAVASVVDDDVNMQELADAVHSVHENALAWLAVSQEPMP